MGMVWVLALVLQAGLISEACDQGLREISRSFHLGSHHWKIKGSASNEGEMDFVEEWSHEHCLARELIPPHQRMICIHRRFGERGVPGSGRYLLEELDRRYPESYFVNSFVEKNAERLVRHLPELLHGRDILEIASKVPTLALRRDFSLHLRVLETELYRIYAVQYPRSQSTSEVFRNRAEVADFLSAHPRFLSFVPPNLPRSH